MPGQQTALHSLAGCLWVNGVFPDVKRGQMHIQRPLTLTTDLPLRGVPVRLAGLPTLTATQHIRAMRGGSQPHMMLASNDKLYVVKFQSNPQGTRVLVNDLIASRLAAAVGLSVPPVEIITVTPWLIGESPELIFKLKNASERCPAGPQFASLFAGGTLPGLTVDYLPEQQLIEAVNLREFAGMLALDKWTCNVDGRQAIFVRNLKQKRYSAKFVDHGYCFSGNTWKYNDLTIGGVFPRNVVYAHVTGWASFEPWLTRIEMMTEETILDLGAQVPFEWCEENTSEIERLLSTLVMRKAIIRDLITAFRKSDRDPFPHWKN